LSLKKKRKLPALAMDDLFIVAGWTIARILAYIRRFVLEIFRILKGTRFAGEKCYIVNWSYLESLAE
jgi:hypothetical protein